MLQQKEQNKNKGPGNQLQPLPFTLLLPVKFPSSFPSINQLLLSVWFSSDPPGSQTPYSQLSQINPGLALENWQMSPIKWWQRILGVIYDLFTLVRKLDAALFFSAS